MTSRRQFLAGLGGVTLVATQPLFRLTDPFLQVVEAQTGMPIGDLKNSLGPADGQVLVPHDPGFDASVTAYNIRTTLRPEIRVFCRSPKGVATTIQWAKSNKVSFSTRGAGHCYEDFSQNLKLVLDTRKLTSSAWNSDSTVSIGSGTTLGSVYAMTEEAMRAFPGGSCPTVGVAGHCLGGGYGRLARPLGLACDSVTSIEMIDANGKTLTASADSNSDLFWALRGAGGGSFGVVTKFTLETYPIGMVSVCSATWMLSVSEAVKTFSAWQDWAPKAPNEITTTMVVSNASGRIKLHLSGQSTGSATKLAREIATWAKSSSSGGVTTSTMSFAGSVERFAGGKAGFVLVPTYIKNRSDYLKKPMTEDGIRTMMNGMLRLTPGAISALCDAYGGKVAEPAADATAFAHRDALYSIQWYCGWGSASQTESKMEMSRQFHKSMRPFVSGYAYVNYPDNELADYANAYWGDNLPRLKQIKSKYDPDNLFRHHQSVPLA